MPRARNPEPAKVFIPGQLSYLPKRPEGELCSLLGLEIPDGCFDHPVLILSTDRRKREAVVFILTSFGGKTLDEYSSNLRARAFHLPIHPSPVHPDNGILLFLDQDLELSKKTYVKTEFQRSIPWELLQPDYRERRTGKQCRLRPDSFARLLECIGSGVAVRQGKSVASQTPLHPPIAHPLERDLLESMRADSLVQYGSINRPTVPPPQVPEPPKYLVRAPIPASTLESMPPPQVPEPPRYSVRASMAASTLEPVVPSREDAAAEVDRYFSQTREARRHEARSILPTHRPSSRSDPADNSHRPMSILRSLFVGLVRYLYTYLTYLPRAIAGYFLGYVIHSLIGKGRGLFHKCLGAVSGLRA